MGVITTGSFAKLLWPGLNTVWGLMYDQFPNEWAELFETQQSDKNYEDDVAVVGLGLAPIKNQGSSVSYDTMSQSFTTRYVHYVVGTGFIVTEEEIEDNLYIKYGTQRTEFLAQSMNQTKENRAADIFNLGFTTQLSGDGVPIFSASHPTASGLQSNILAVSADLSEASLEQMLINIRNTRNERGLRANVMGQKLVIPSALQFEAERILKNPDRPATADRDINAMYQMGKLPEGYVINDYLSDSDAYYILTNVKNGFKHFERRALSFTTDNDFDTENAKFKATERYSFGVTDWRQGYASQGA